MLRIRYAKLLAKGRESTVGSFLVSFRLFCSHFRFHSLFFVTLILILVKPKIFVTKCPKTYSVMLSIHFWMRGAESDHKRFDLLKLFVESMWSWCGLWSVIAQRKVGVGSRRRGLPAAGASEPSAELTLRTFNREVSDIFVDPAFVHMWYPRSSSR